MSTPINKTTLKERFEIKFGEKHIISAREALWFTEYEVINILDTLEAEVKRLKTIPIETPHGSPYISGNNEALSDVLALITTLRQ